MRIHPERSGREPGQESPPRTEITAQAHAVAQAVTEALAEAHEERRYRLGMRRTWMERKAYGTFSIYVDDPEAPPSVRGRGFHADFDAEHFHYQDLPRGLRGRRALSFLRYLDPDGDRKRRERDVQGRQPVPDHVAEELAGYIAGEADAVS